MTMAGMKRRHPTFNEQREQWLEETRCRKCGSRTYGEMAWVNEEIWCHPCADSISSKKDQEQRHA